MFSPGDIVRISDVLMRAGMRAETVPEDTRECDFVMRLTGVLVGAAAHRTGDEPGECGAQRSGTKRSGGKADQSAVGREEKVHLRPGDRVVVRTASGRLVEGVLDPSVPGYQHTFGPTVAELAWIGSDARKRVTGYLG